MATRSRKSPNLYVFARRIQSRAVAVAGLANEYKKHVAFRVLEQLVMATPVDTSQALSNWQVANASTGPITAPIPAYAEGIWGSTAGVSSAAAIRAGAAVIRLTPKMPGMPVVVSNVVDYIGELAYPPYKSPQASGDWVGLASAVGLRQGAREANSKVVW